MVSQIPQLNDDVLLAIFSYIHGEDALHVALSSKRFHVLAAPGVAKEASCWEYKMVPRLCDYMLSRLRLNSPPRARHLRVLVFMPVTFFQKLGSNFLTLVTMTRVTDLLAEAHDLRVLRWTADFEDHFNRDPARLSAIFRSWRYLSVLELHRVTDEMISLLQDVTTLRVLILRLKVSQHGEEHGMATLLKTLSQLDRLHTLSLGHFRSPDTSNITLEGWSPVPRYPSILDLSLTTCSTSYLLLVQQCPNLSRLAIAYPVGTPFGSQILPPVSLGPRWPTLQSLAISTRDLALCGLDQLKPVRELQLGDAPFENSSAPRILPLVLPTLSPLSISVSASFRMETSPSWDALANYQPGVRILDIDVNPHSYRPWSDTWHVNLPKALNRLPLVSLRLILRAPSSSGIKVGAALDDPTRMQTTYRRKEALSTIPRKVFDVVRTLHILAIAEEADQVARPLASAGAAAGTPKAQHVYMEDRTEDLADRERRMEWEALDRTRYRFHWWCRATSVGEPIRVPEREGERAYRAILNACATGESASTADIEQLVASMSLE